jgi:hypothetical protein
MDATGAYVDRSTSSPVPPKVSERVGTFAVMDLTIGESTFEHIETTGPAHVAASAFDVDGLLTDIARFAVGSIDGLGVRGGLAPPERLIDRGHLLTYCTTHVEVDGAAVPAWADLSGLYPTDGGRHLQIHCNFPHHAAGVVALTIRLLEFA